MTVKLHPVSHIFISMILCLLFQGCGQAKEHDKQSAPDFTLQDLSGTEVSLRQHKGQIVFLDFWATWCTPCRRSIPELVDLQEKYRDQGLVVLGISADDPRRTSVNTLLAFKKQFRINYSILRADRHVTTAYFGPGQVPLPTLFVIDREGRVVDSIVGYAPGAAERSLKKLLS
jgi:peroxiredoxin